MLRTLTLCSFALLLLSGATRAQTSWTVDDNGPADFATIAAAVGSALVHDGDVLLVEPGSYGAFTTSKDLAIVGNEGGAKPSVSGESHVDNVDSFTLAGLDLFELRVLGAAGRVAIEDCEIGHESKVGSGAYETFVIEDCAEVVVSNALLQGKIGDETTYVESPGVNIRNSHVAVVNCEIHGGEGADAFLTGLPGEAGVDIEDGSLVVIAACSITGGSGGSGVKICSSFGASAIRVSDSALWVKGNASHVLDSGEDCPPGDNYAISGSAADVVVSGVTLENPPFSPALTIGGSLSQPSPPEPFLTVTGEPGPPGPRRLNLYGPAGSVALVLVSLQPLYATLPKIQGGPLWLDPAGQILSLQVPLTGQSISVNVLFPLPATGDFAGFTAWLQAFLPAGGSKWLSLNPGSIVLRF